MCVQYCVLKIYPHKHSHTHILSHKHFLTNIISHTQVVQVLQPQEIIAGEFIFQKGDSSNEMHFLLAGRAEIYSDELMMTLKVLVSGSYFGEDAVMNATRCNNSHYPSFSSLL